MGIDSIVGFSDDNGAFVLEGAPTGDIAVGCRPSTQYWSDGRADLTVAGGQDATCEIPVVKSNPEAPMLQYGAQLDPSSTTPRFSVVTPHDAADNAGIRVGDVVATVDGANVAKLTPWGVHILIAERSPGTTARLGLTRGAQSLKADLVVGGR